MIPSRLRPSPSASPFDLEASARHGVRSPWLTAATGVLALLQQSLGHMNCDSSWFMTFAEKVLAGAVPYVDVSDPNPPAAFLAYVPALLFARLLHIAPEAIVVGITFVGALLSIVSAGFILTKSDLLKAEDAVPALSAAIFAILVVPAFCFAEREHFAVILLLPFLALCAARVRGAKIALPLAIIVGVAAGLALAFKPYFLLPIGLAALCAPARHHSARRAVTPETLAAAAIVSLYGLVIARYVPFYFSNAMPLIKEVYLPAREGLFEVVTLPAFLANIGLLLALGYAVERRGLDPRVLVLGAASVGFVATYLIQSKGWMNHAYPGMALALLAGTFVVFAPRDAAGSDRRRSFTLFMFLPSLVAAPLFFGALIDFDDAEEFPGLRAAVERLAPAHPKLAALAEELDLGHPLVRQLGGTWVGEQNCLWTSYAVRYLFARDGQHMTAERRARLLQLKDQDEAIFAKNVAQGRPDVLLVETPAIEAWARREPALTGLFSPYRLAGRAGTVSIWLRNQS